jgi:hypothetical protein
MVSIGKLPGVLGFPFPRKGGRVRELRRNRQRRCAKDIMVIVT